MYEIESRLEIDIDDIIPLLLGHPQEQCVFGNASVIDQNIYLSEVFHDLFHHLVGLFKVGSITGVSATDDPFGFNRLTCLFHLVVEHEVGKRYLAALFRQAKRNRLADAACGTRYKGCLVFRQLLHSRLFLP